MSYQDIARFAAMPVQESLIKSASVPMGNRVFISHSWKDKGHIRGVRRFFGKLGAHTYVDSHDPELPSAVSQDTAVVLSGQIFVCPRLVVLVSPASKDSRWIPWELGLAHGLRGVAPIATLPIDDQSKENDEGWSQREYLGLYPRIRWDRIDGQGTRGWVVADPRDGKAWTLKYWLSAKEIE